MRMGMPFLWKYNCILNQTSGTWAGIVKGYGAESCLQRKGAMQCRCHLSPECRTSDKFLLLSEGCLSLSASLLGMKCDQQPPVVAAMNSPVWNDTPTTWSAKGFLPTLRGFFHVLWYSNGEKKNNQYLCLLGFS